MLEGLQQIDWGKLKHAYGAAKDVPGLIRALASPKKRMRDKALYELYGNIFHQGTRYPATAHAVPFLFELLREPGVQEKHEIIALLVHLAIGYDEEHLPGGFRMDE